MAYQTFCFCDICEKPIPFDGQKWHVCISASPNAWPEDQRFIIAKKVLCESCADKNGIVSKHKPVNRAPPPSFAELLADLLDERIEDKIEEEFKNRS